MKNSTLLLAMAALLALFSAAGCGDKTVTTKAPAVTAQEQPAKVDPESGGATPGASTLGIQENPNGTNPGLGSR